MKRLDDLALRPAFIKIDVQGFEAQVVAGLRRTITECRPVLLLERSGCNEDLHRQLAGLGYTAFVYLPGRAAFMPYRDQPAQNLFFLSAVQAELAGVSKWSVKGQLNGAEERIRQGQTKRVPTNAD